MGEVYKARDTRLERTVAIKVLPPALASDAEFRERFEREAKSISALNHPNICTLHDIGRLRVSNASASAGPSAGKSADQGEIDFLVMEFLDGETLAARLSKGPVPLADALKIGTEIAGALDKAHRSGIVHRDLKPGNVMLTKTGSKLLDFGLAKVGPAGAVSGAYVTALPTAAAPLTAQGTILGTFQYMSPEQIEGDATDARSDIFAFGALLYEMLTGRKAFTGKSQASLLGAILKDDPPAVSQAQPLVPPVLDHVVRTCLAKDPDARFQTAHDLLLQLKWIAGGSGSGVAAPAVNQVADWRRGARLGWILAAALGVVCLGTATMTVIHVREAPPVAAPIQFTISSPENSLFGGQAPQFAVSPDGRHVVFVASLQNSGVLWIRTLATLAARPLPGTESPSYPFWSADSRFIGFFAGGKLKKVPVSGGPPVPLTDAPNGRGGTWNTDNVIVFAPTTSGPLHRVTSAGGTSTPVTEPSANEMSHRFPTFLPDGRHYLFSAGLLPSAGEIRVGALDEKSTTLVANSNANAKFADGHVLFVRDGSLMAQPFNPDTRETTADAFPIAEQVSTDGSAYVAMSASSTGLVAYARGSSRPIARLTWFDRTGKLLGTAGDPGEYYNLSLSLDERRVAVSLHSGSPPNRDVWLLDLTRAGAPSRFTFDSAQDGLPIWSSDGTQVAFVSTRNGPWNIYLKASATGGQEELVIKSPTTHYLSDWSRDKRFIAYANQAPTTNGDLWVLPMTGEKNPVLFLQTPFIEENPVFSPDGRWIAYDSNESGPTQVYVRPFPVAAGQYMVSRNGGSQPQWRDDSRELFFLAPDGAMMAASVATTKDFEADVPQKLFPTGIAFTGNRRQYAVTKDGKRFLANVPEQRTSPSPITVVVNWLAALQK